ncbi:MAG: dihydrolipoyl dehydrogenase [Thermoleophilia bacterium]|nr:dihydrolipoyl dehydrogenase [Thermoleophilia bacterium]
MTSETADIVIIGGGPGGYVAALRAAQLGAEVVLVERDTVGGTCLNRGCIPTKALVSSVGVLDYCRNAASYGVKVGSVSPDYGRMIARKDKTVAQLVRGVEHLLRRAGVRVLTGSGSILEPGLVEMRRADGSSERVSARAIIIATGSEPAELPELPYDGARIINSTHALQLHEAPESLVIVGAGAVGMEFATIFHSLGTHVTVVEMSTQVLPSEDKDIAEHLGREYRKRRIGIITDAGVQRVGEQDGESVLELSNGEFLKAARVLVAAGRAPNIHGIGLEEVGVAFGNDGAKVDGHMETNIRGIYAIGDVVGGWLLAHVASKQGVIAAENIMGMPSEMDYRVVPRTVWTLPQVASVGITEEEAKRTGLAVRAGKFPFRALGMALAMGEADGFVKIVGDAGTDELLGAQMIGPDVTNLIAEVGVAMRLESTVEELALTTHAHPTLPEALMEAAQALHGQAIHA